VSPSDISFPVARSAHDVFFFFSRYLQNERLVEGEIKKDRLQEFIDG
jgi:hypothetical protein